MDGQEGREGGRLSVGRTRPVFSHTDVGSGVGTWDWDWQTTRPKSQNMHRIL